MIEVRVADLTAVGAAAILRPVAADWSAVSAASRRVEILAGPVVLEQCHRLGELPVGSAVITGAGELPASFLVHVAVRSFDQQVTPAVIRRALSNGLRRLDDWGIESVALPPLGTGAGNLDAEEAAAVMIPALLEHLRNIRRPLKVILAVETEYERGAFDRQLSYHSRLSDDPDRGADAAPGSGSTDSPG